jgi:drug/metabolite transporter (DMT)-like permease
MSHPGNRIGLIFAVLGAVGFSFKAILIKLAYPYGVDAVTLLALRMGLSLPFFLALGWADQRRRQPALAGRDWGLMLGLGFSGYYLASYLDFLGLQYISAALERLILFAYPTLVVLFSAFFLGKPVTRRAAGQSACATPASPLPLPTTSIWPAPPPTCGWAGRWCSAARFRTPST